MHDTSNGFQPAFSWRLGRLTTSFGCSSPTTVSTGQRCHSKHFWRQQVWIASLAGSQDHHHHRDIHATSCSGTGSHSQTNKSPTAHGATTRAPTEPTTRSRRSKEEVYNSEAGAWHTIYASDMEPDCYTSISHAESGTTSQSSVNSTTGQTCAYYAESFAYGWTEPE